MGRNRSLELWGPQTDCDISNNGYRYSCRSLSKDDILELLQPSKEAALILEKVYASIYIFSRIAFPAAKCVLPAVHTRL